MVKIQLRGDAGFCREKLMAWCEREGIDYIFGLAQNPRLKKQIEAEIAQAEEQYAQAQVDWVLRCGRVGDPRLELPRCSAVFLARPDPPGASSAAAARRSDSLLQSSQYRKPRLSGGDMVLLRPLP